LLHKTPTSLIHLRGRSSSSSSNIPIIITIQSTAFSTQQTDNSEGEGDEEGFLEAFRVLDWGSGLGTDALCWEFVTLLYSWM